MSIPRAGLKGSLPFPAAYHLASHGGSNGLCGHRLWMLTWGIGALVALLGCVVVSFCISTTTTEGGSPEVQVTKLGTLSFPMSFEEDQGGTCPQLFTCSRGNSIVCKHPHATVRCAHPGLGSVHGRKYLMVASDTSTGFMTSPIFVLPAGVDRLYFLRSGGADQGSGFYLHLAEDDSLICRSENGRDSNIFSLEHCAGLGAHAGKPVYMCLVDNQKSDWGKVLIDDISLRDEHGHQLSQADWVATTRAKPDCSDLHGDSVGHVSF